jgi:NAD(P)-dependent dehydrogenase (short-subunit alcohol dehydrogenase family)
VTGAGSGIGLAFSEALAQRGCHVVLADIDLDDAEAAAEQIRGRGGRASARRVDVCSVAEVEQVVTQTLEQHGRLDYLFNNAGIGVAGEVVDHTIEAWNRIIGVNLLGVIYGVQCAYPAMIRQGFGHIVNTASMAGLLNPPNMGVYNVSKHAVVSLSETLYQDLRLVTDQISASVLCPFFVPTGISASERNRPAGSPAAKPTRSQLIGKAMTDKAVGHGKVSAADVAQFVFDAVEADRFYIYSHPKALGSVQTRLEDVVQARNPTDPFAGKPEIGAELRAALRAPG